jgi:hypothetical protein
MASLPIRAIAVIGARPIEPSLIRIREQLYGPRVIGLQIRRHGDVERRPVKHEAMPFYTVGRSICFELYHSELQSLSGSRIVDGPNARMSSLREGAGRTR